MGIWFPPTTVLLTIFDFFFNYIVLVHFVLVMYGYELCLKIKDRDTRCNKSLRYVVATGCCNKSPRVTCGNHSRCDRILSPRSVEIRATNRSDKISASSLVAACVRIFDKSLRQNLNQPMRKHQLVSRHVKFELIHISSLPKSIGCTEQVPYRSDLSQHQCRREDFSPRRVAAQRFVASCVSPLKIKVALTF